jgi:hypothetical protein
MNVGLKGDSAVANEMPVESRLLRRWAEWKAKLLPERLGWTPNDIIRLVELREEGHNFSEIARIIDKGAYYAQQIYKDMSNVLIENDVSNCEVGKVYTIEPNTLRDSNDWSSSTIGPGPYECIDIVYGEYTTHYIFRNVLGGSKTSFTENEKGYLFKEVSQ